MAQWYRGELAAPDRIRNGHGMNPKAPPGPSQDAEERFLEEMNGELAGWSDPVPRLKQALAQDELQLFSQPILLLRPPGGFPMAEVLVRLREEEALMLPPGDFLPVFEHYRMMVEFDRWVLRSALRWIARSPAAAIRRYSINVSSQSLEEGKFHRFVGAALQSTRVAPQALTFEIDESDTLARLDAAARFSLAVKKMGCRVMIDGFGRRSVSFAALKKLRADFVKVDGAIVRALLRSEVARQKLKAVVRVGEALGVEVVGECVEERDVLARLRDMRVGFAQGFGIARPAPIDRPPAPPQL
jgi:EAL domain-containing protein (putative c-di-GMP-specific phosphodiesterase class I)